MWTLYIEPFGWRVELYLFSSPKAIMLMYLNSLRFQKFSANDYWQFYFLQLVCFQPYSCCSCWQVIYHFVSRYRSNWVKIATWNIGMMWKEGERSEWAELLIAVPLHLSWGIDIQGSTVYWFLETKVHGKPIIFLEIMAYLTQFQNSFLLIWSIFMRRILSIVDKRGRSHITHSQHTQLFLFHFV